MTLVCACDLSQRFAYTVLSAEKQPHPHAYHRKSTYLTVCHVLSCSPVWYSTILQSNALIRHLLHNIAHVIKNGAPGGGILPQRVAVRRAAQWSWRIAFKTTEPLMRGRRAHRRQSILEDGCCSAVCAQGPRMRMCPPGQVFVGRAKRRHKLNEQAGATPLS